MSKRIIYFITLIFISLLLVGCSSNKVSDYKRTDYGIFSMYNLYVLQSRSEFDSVECANCLKSLGVTESFCRTYETINLDGVEDTLSDLLNDKRLEDEQVDCLIEHKVVKHYRFPYIFYKIGEIIFYVFKGL